MTTLALVAVAAWWRFAPVAAEVDWGPVGKALDWGLGFGLAALFLRLLVKGDLRRAGEVDDLSKRLAAAEERADKAEEARQRVQDAVLKEQGLASMELAVQGKQLVASATRMQELMEKLIDAFLQRLER